MVKYLILPSFALFVLSASAEVTVKDSVDTHSISEVVVTGTNHAVDRNLLPYSVSTVSRAEIDATGQTQLLSALSGEVPGLFVTQRNIFGFGVSNGGSGGIKIRGVGGSPTNSVLMMVDGQPQFAGIYSHHVADFYETEYVDHVEILRGPASVLYGSNAMGGVINVITCQAQKEGMETTVKSEYGSYNTWQSSVTNMARCGKFSSLASLGYDRTNGVEKNFDFKQYSAYAKVGYDFSMNWNVRADYSLMQFIGNDPIYAKLSDPSSTDVYHQNVIRGESSVMVNNMYSQTNGAVRVYYSYGNHYVDDPRHFHSLDDRFGVLAYQNLKPWKYTNATVGFDFDTYTGEIPMSGGNSYNDNTTAAKMQTIHRKSITEYSPYVTVSQDLFCGAVIFSGGLRMANSDRFGTHWVPQLGVVTHPEDSWTLKASMSKGYRNPSFKEMYLYKMANEDLEPEDMMNYEVSVGKSFSNLFSVEVTGFYSEGGNMIQVLNMKNVNTGTFYNKGVEVSANSHVCNNVMLRSSYSYLYSSHDNLTGAPKNQYFLGVGWKALKQLTVDAELKGVGGLYVADDVDNQNYALLGMKITYKPLNMLDVFVNLDNLTNQSYMIMKGYEMPGFTAMGGLKLKF